MSKYKTLTITTALGLALVAGVARADGPGDGYSGQEISTIRYLNRAQNLVELTDGKELHVTDPRLLANLEEGELVKVDFTKMGDRLVVNSIEPADAGTSLDGNPGAVGGTKEH